MNVSADTIALVRDILQKGGTPDPLAKAFTFAQPGVATQGLQNYDLEHAVRSFVPFFSPIRNRTPRTKANGGMQANWKAVTAVDSGQMYAGVGEGQRGGLIGVTSADYYAAYRTLGRESSVSFEAQNAGVGLDDLRARAVMSLVQSTMQEEEKIILGGNSLNPLGTTPTPTLTTATTGGSLAATTTYSVICVALTFDAYRRFAGQSTIYQTFSRTNMDGSTTVVSAGTAIKSANATIATGAGSTNSITASVTPVRGAYGYAWFFGPAGSELLAGITTLAKFVATVVPSGTTAASSFTGTDYSRDTLIHDGLLGFCGNASLNSYYYAQSNGVGLTPDGTGGIVEFDTALRWFWDNYRISPDRILINSQEAVSIKHIIVQQGVQTSLARWGFQMTPNGMVGGAMAKGYYNPFGTMQEIPIEQHPFMVPGTVLFLTESLPYPMNNVQNVMEVECRQDYWQTEWPLVTRSYQFGVYTDQVLKHYFPPSMGIITNLSPS